MNRTLTKKELMELIGKEIEVNEIKIDAATNESDRQYFSGGNSAMRAVLMVLANCEIKENEDD